MKKYTKLTIIGVLATTMISTTVLAQRENQVHAISPDVATTYTVKAGDTLWGISRTNNLEVSELQAVNNLNTTLIHPGDKLVVRTNAKTDSTVIKENVTTHTTEAEVQAKQAKEAEIAQQQAQAAQAAQQAQVAQQQSQTQTTLPSWEFNTLCAVIQQEAGVEYSNAKAVMSTIYNRVHSDGMFPASYSAVISQPGQFESYSSGAYNKHLGNISNGVRQAVTDVLNNGPIHNYKFFWSASYAASQGRTGQNIGGNVFFNY